MKLKNILEDLKEEFAGHLQIGWSGDEYPVFLNPTLQEIREVVADDGYIRYITTFEGNKYSKEVYVWNADGAMHTDASEYLNIRLDDLYGVAKLEGRKLLIGSEVLPGYNPDFRIRERDLKDILDGYYDWLEEYGFDIGRVKEEYNEEDLEKEMDYSY